MVDNSQVASSWRLGPEALISAAPVPVLIGAIDAVFENFRSNSADPQGQHLEASLDDEGGWRLRVLGAPLVRVSGSPELAPFVERLLVAHAVWAQKDAAAFHAGAVGIGGQGVLLLGGKGSGKSTLTLALARSGAEYLSDEVAFVRYSGDRVLSFPKHATIKESGRDLFPGLDHEPVHFCPRRGEIRYARIKSDPLIEYPVSWIVMPVFEPGRKNVLVEELEPGEVALNLVRQMFGGLERGGKRAIELVGRLSALPALRISSSDPSAGAEAIREAVV